MAVTLLGGWERVAAAWEARAAEAVVWVVAAATKLAGLREARAAMVGSAVP